MKEVRSEAGGKWNSPDGRLLGSVNWDSGSRGELDMKDVEECIKWTIWQYIGLGRGVSLGWFHLGDLVNGVWYWPSLGETKEEAGLSIWKRVSALWHSSQILDFIIFLLCLQSYRKFKKYEKTFEYRSLFPMDIRFWYTWYTYFKIVSNSRSKRSIMIIWNKWKNAF